MNLFLNFFNLVLFYHLLFYSTVVCRISDKRKCANADCSVPVSEATTLLNYYADDDRLLSFPRNVKLKIYSKEAGDTPNFWEAEEEGSNKCMNYQGSRNYFLDLCQEAINGKRGYVPKGLLRENKVFIASNKLTHIVPTGRVDTASQNATDENLKDQNSNSINLLSATPELPVANSKGLFSTIGGVSADSVPMNSPDIKPQSTRKFQVFDGTTLYDDVVTEKPESPPIIIDDSLSKNKESENSQTADLKDVPRDSNVPSSEIKPVNEVSNENEEAIKTENENEKELNQLTKQDESSSKEESEGKVNEFEEEALEEPSNTFLHNIVNTMSSMVFSGAGEDIIEGEEDEDETGSAEEDDDYESETEESSEKTTKKESGEHEKLEMQPLETSHLNMTESPDMNNITGDITSDLKPNDALNSEHTILKHESEKFKELIRGNISSKENREVIEETKKSEIEFSSDGEGVTVEGQEEIISKPIEVNKSGSDSTQGSEFLKEEKTQVPDLKTSTVVLNNVLNLTPKQSETEDLQQLSDEMKNKDGTLVENENISELTEKMSNEAPEYQSKSDTEAPQIQEQPKTDEHEGQEQPETDKPNGDEQTKTEDSEGQERPKIDEQKEQELSKTDKLQLEVKPKTNVLTGQEQHITDNSQVLEQSETPTDSPPLETMAHQALFGSRQFNKVSPEEQHTYETSEPSKESEPEDKMKLAEPSNNTSQGEDFPSSDSTYTTLPSVQSIGSPKYSSVISRRIQSSESSVNILPHSEENEDYDHDDKTENQPVYEESLSPNLLPKSQSPKYSNVVGQRIGFFASEEISEVKKENESNDVTAAEEKSGNVPAVKEGSETEVKSVEESEFIEGTGVETKEVPVDTQQPISDDVSIVHVIDETPAEVTPGEGMFSWVSSAFDVFRSKDSAAIEESQVISENLDPSRTTQIPEETCSADGLEGSCHSFGDTMQKEVTWQETSYTADIWELMERVPLEATIWLIVTALVVLIFSLGHYYIEAHRRDGPLVAIINKLEREVLILKKENCIFEDRLQIAQQQLEAWNTSSSENDALIVELKQELEETKLAKAELEEVAAQLKEELESVTESGLEMHRLLEESLSSQDGSQVLLSTVETLREKLQRQEEEISGLSDTLSSKNAEVEELHGSLAQAGEVARRLEDKVIAVTREKEEELLQLRDKHRELISQLEEVMETKALEETRLSTEMSKLRLNIEELQKTLAEKDAELDTLKEVVKQLRATDSNEKIDALFDVVGVQAKLKTAGAERDDFREKFLEEEGARKLLEGHMKKITQEVADLKDSFETAEKEKIEALTKLQVLSNYFKEKESQLQKELGLQESMWLQKQSDDHTIYEQMRSLREENEKYKLQNESLKKEIVEQEASFKIQLANTEQKAHENWVASRQAERRLKEAQQESAQLRNRLTTVEKNSANYSLDEKPNISESNGDPSSPPPSLMYPPTTSPPFMMYGPPLPGDFVPPPPLMGSPYPSDSRPPPLGRISSPPLDHRFSPPPPLPYPPYDYPAYGHHSPSPPPPMPSHHRNLHKPQPRELSREQKDHVPNYSPEAEKTSRRNKR